MVDDVKHISETGENKATADSIDRARLARERREAEQRKRLDELRAHAAAAQEQREKRDEERRQRQAEQKARDDDRRQQVEERKRAIWEASVSRREALLQREKERTERMERARAARSSSRSAFAFGSSTPRLLEPVDSAGFFWTTRRAASTTNVMFASAPLTRPASALQLDLENDSRDESDRHAQAVMWSSVARRRTDLVPTLPARRAPGRAFSMTRLDKIPANRLLHSASPSMHHLNRTQMRSGETTPGSRPGSAMSNAITGVVRRPTAIARKPRPASIAGTGVNTPRGGGGDTGSLSVATTPSVSRDGTLMAGGDVPRRPQTAPRRPRPVSVNAPAKHCYITSTLMNPAEGKPPLHRKPKLPKDHDQVIIIPGDKSQVSAMEVTQKLEALQIQSGNEYTHELTSTHNQIFNNISEIEDLVEVPKINELEKPMDSNVDVQETAVDNSEENEMTASITARRITTEEEAKAALAERRRRAREELERQAERERQREQREAEEKAERQRQEERREEEEARELAQLQRCMEEEKLRKAIEAQQQLERDEAERKAREEAERQARLKEEEGKRKAADEAERLRKEEAEREEKERLARKQRVEAIMARTRLKKSDESKLRQESGGFKEHSMQSSNTLQPKESANATPNNGNLAAVLLGLSEKNNTEDNAQEQASAGINKLDNLPNVNAPPLETNNGNVQQTNNVGHTERMSAENSQTKMAENVPKLMDDDFTSHNGHGAAHNHPLTLQNAI